MSLANANAQAADSEILERNAQLQQAQLNLSYAVIHSPITGVVGKRRVEVGQNVSVGQDLIDVASLDDVWITANFNEKQLGRIRPGQPVEIMVDAYGRTWTGHVTNLGGGTGSVFSGMPPKNALANAKATPRVPVRIDFDRPESQAFNAEDLLKPGLSIEPKVRVRWVPRTRTLDTSTESRGRPSVRLRGGIAYLGDEGRDTNVCNSRLRATRSTASQAVAGKHNRPAELGKPIAGLGFRRRSPMNPACGKAHDSSQRSKTPTVTRLLVCSPQLAKCPRPRQLHGSAPMVWQVVIHRFFLHVF